MAIDTQAKRMAAAGCGRPWMRATFPTGTIDAEERASIGNTYGGNAFAAGEVAAPTHTVVLCDASSGKLKVTLPVASGNRGRAYFIKKIDPSANPVDIDVAESGTIEGSLMESLEDEGEAIMVVSDDADWYIV